jgi:lysine 2,3-aminomutase
MPDGLLHPKPAIRTVDGIIRAGLAPEAARAGLEAVGRRYAIAIPTALRALIGAADDPIGLQFIPDAAELVTAAHESADPIGDDALSPVRGVVHRYPDRALLKPLPVLFQAGAGGAGWRGAEWRGTGGGVWVYRGACGNSGGDSDGR